MSLLKSAPAFWGTRTDDHRINAPELLTKSTAAMLARRLEAYWRQRGKRVACRVELVAGGRIDGHGSMHVVRSDMVGGMPR